MVHLKVKMIDDKLMVHWAEDDQGVRYYVKQVETGIEYSEAVDLYPSKYTYVATNKKVEEIPDEYSGENTSEHI